MTAATETGRTLEASIEIDAPVEAVWRALTDAERLTNWFPLDARVKPGVGGSIWMSWGEMEAEMPIDVWEDNRRIRLVYCEATPPEKMDEAKAMGMVMPHRLTTDYHLEANGNRTVLRVVNAGYGVGEMWDNQYDGTVRGWAFELRGLRHYLEHHQTSRRRVVHAKHTLDSLDWDAWWSRLAGPEGLNAIDALAGLGEGDRYAFTTSGGDVFEGEIHINTPPRDLCATVEGFNNALLRLRLDPGSVTQPNPEINLWLSTYDLDDSTVDGLQGRMDALMERSCG